MEKLNIYEQYIVQLHNRRTFSVDIDKALQTIQDQQDQQSLIDRKFIHSLRIDNMVSVVKVSVQEKYDTEFSEIAQKLSRKIEHFKWGNNEKFQEKLSKVFKKMETYTNSLVTKAISNEINKKLEEKVEKRIKDKVRCGMMKQIDGEYNQKLDEYKSEVENQLFADNKNNQSPVNERHISLTSHRLKLKEKAGEFLANVSQLTEHKIFMNFLAIANGIIESILENEIAFDVMFENNRANRRFLDDIPEECVSAGFDSFSSEQKIVFTLCRPLFNCIRNLRIRIAYK